VITGMGLAVAAAVLERPGMAVVGVLAAGGPGLYHAVRSGVLENQLRAVAAERAEQPALERAEQPALERAEQPAPTPVETPAETASAPAPEPDNAFGLVDARIDTGELQRIWDRGDGPDTGELPRVPADAGVLVGAASARRGERFTIGTAEARVFDAIVLAEADELTRALELPSRRGRHAAAASDAPPARRGPDLADARTAPPSGRPELVVVRHRRGRHAAA
jgi:hypothetical protein